jgi:uncharacterized protein YkwD
MTSIDFQYSQHPQALRSDCAFLQTSAKLAIALVCLVLSACSGQDAATSQATTSKATAIPQTSKELAQNPAVLTLTAPLPNAAFSSQFQAQAQSQASAASFSPVTRIQNTSLPGSYFFTIYNLERNAALSSHPNWDEEGTAFWASTVADTGLSPVHRFQNKLNGSYLYTIYDAERADIVANYAATFTYEGTAWYAQQTQSAGWSPLYRFRNLTNGTYLFSANEVEKDNIVANYASTFKLEGVAYYVWQDPTPQPDTTCGLANFKADLLAIVNAHRAAGAVCKGADYPDGKALPAVGALKWNLRLQEAATGHSTDMSTNDFFSHTGSDGRRLAQRLPAAGYFYSTAGENIAAGYTTVAQVVAAWMSSTQGHCENIMKDTHRDIGVSCKINEASTYKTYWTMDFGAR